MWKINIERKFSLPQGREVRLSLLWRCKTDGDESRLVRTDATLRVLNWSLIPSRKPFTKINGKEGHHQRRSITGNGKGKIEENFEYPFAQSFPCAGASFPRNTSFFFIWSKRPFFRPVTSRLVMSNTWIREPADLPLTTLTRLACSAEVSTKVQHLAG